MTNELSNEQDVLDQLLKVAEAIAMSRNFDEVEPLLELAGRHAASPRVAALAEAFARMVVQLEIREYRLERTIEDLLKVKAELELANYDALTGLPNRVIFRDRLRQGVAQAQRSGKPLAVMYLDLDRFKWVNDNLGHAAGDELLRQVCGRLGEVVRESDTLARLGGDEFACVLPELDDPTIAETIAARFVEVLNEPFQLAAGAANIGTSIGIAFHPAHHKEAEALLKLADQAMYEAKRGGRNRYCLHAPEGAAPAP